MKTYNIKKGIIYNSESIKLLQKRRLKEIVSPTSLNLDEDEKVFICDNKNIYGIVILNKANTLDREQLNNHFSRHCINKEFIDEVWSCVTKFNVHTFRIKKVFKDPLEFRCINKDFNMGELLTDIEIIDREKELIEAKINKYKVRLETLKGLKYSDKNSVLKEAFLELFQLIIEKKKQKELTNA